MYTSLVLPGIDVFFKKWFSVVGKMIVQRREEGGVIVFLHKMIDPRCKRIDHQYMKSEPLYSTRNHQFAIRGEIEKVAEIGDLIIETFALIRKN